MRNYPSNNWPTRAHVKEMKRMAEEFFRKQRGEAAMQDALAAIECVLGASFIEWSEEISPSKRGHADGDEVRQEAKSMVHILLSEAAEKLRAALAS